MEKSPHLWKKRPLMKVENLPSTCEKTAPNCEKRAPNVKKVPLCGKNAPNVEKMPPAERNPSGIYLENTLQETGTIQFAFYGFACEKLKLG